MTLFKSIFQLIYILIAVCIISYYPNIHIIIIINFKIYTFTINNILVVTLAMTIIGIRNSTLLLCH